MTPPNLSSGEWWLIATLTILFVALLVYASVMAKKNPMLLIGFFGKVFRHGAGCLIGMSGMGLGILVLIAVFVAIFGNFQLDLPAWNPTPTSTPTETPTPANTPTTTPTETPTPTPAPTESGRILSGIC